MTPAKRPPDAWPEHAGGMFGGVKGGGLALKQVADAKQNAVGVGEHVVVPEANDAVAFRFEPARARRIGFFLIHMLSAVDFEDEIGFRTEEIDDIAADGLLAAKAEAVELLMSKTFP